MHDLNEIAECVAQIKRTPKYALDLETTGLDVTSDIIIGVSFTIKRGGKYRSWYFKPSPEMPEKALFKQFEPFMLDTQKLCIMHNAKFDTSMLRGRGIPLYNQIACTQIMAWIIDENRSGTGRLKLKGKGSLTHELFGVELASYSESTLSGSLFGKDEAVYAMDDTLYTYKCFEKLKPQLKKQKLEKLFWELEMQVLPVVADMEWRGMYLDTTALWKLEKDLLKKHDDIEQKFFSIIGRKINIGSTEQLSALFFDELKWKLKPGMERGKNGCFSTDEATLSKYVEQDHEELAQLVLDYRGAIKMLQTYVRPFVKLALSDPESRIHASVHQTGTVTGRFCVSGDTLVHTMNGKAPIQDIKVGDYVFTHKYRYKPVLNVIVKGFERMWHVYTESGKEIRCTINHRFLTDCGWKSLKDLHFNDYILMSDALDDPEKVMVDRQIWPERISWFGPGEVEEVWDIEVEEDHSYIGNGFVNHNSSSKPNLQNCFDSRTEILTDSGWMLFKDITYDTKVAQFNKHSELVSFVNPDKIISYAYSGDMVHVKNQHIDLFVTPDHNCLLKNRKNGKYTDVKAINYLKDAIQLNASMLDADSEMSTDISENLMRLVIATQADAWYQEDTICYQFDKKRKQNRIEELLKINNVQYTTSIHRKTAIRYRIRSKDPIIIKIKGILGDNKIFPKWFISLPENLRSVFCNEIMLWDGCQTRNNHYSSCIEENADIVQALFILSGIRANRRIYLGKNRVHYQIDKTNRNYSLTSNAIINIIPYTGNVYCVSVSSGYIVIRREGKVCITGNCPREKGTIKAAFKSPPGKTLIVSDYSQLELRLMAHLSQDPTMLEIYRTGGDIHQTTQDAIGCKERATAKNCLDESTIISTSNGIQSIGHILGDLSDEEIKAVCVDVADGKGGYLPTKYAIAHAEQPCSILVTKRGIVCGSNTHSFLLNSGKLSSISDLKKGDILQDPIIPEIKDSSFVTVKVNPFTNEVNTGPCVLTLNEDWAYLAGVLHGDGCSSGTHSVTISHGTTEYYSSWRDEIKKLLDTVGIPNFIGTDKRNTRLGSRVVHKFLSQLDMCDKKNSLGIRVPWWVLSGGKKTVAAYISGVIDTDGTISKSISFTTKDPLWAGQLSLLCRALGANLTIEVSHNKTYHRDYYRVRILTLGAKEFSENLSLRSYKKEKLEKYVSNIKFKRLHDTPNEVLQIIPVGNRRVYDFEVDSSDHLYLQGPFIGHNTNFGYIYGMSAPTFQANLWRTARIALSLEDCRKFEAAFFKKYTGIKPYHAQVEEFLRKHKYVRTLAGRRRHLADEMKNNYSSALRQAINFTVQGFGSDIVKIAMRNFQREILHKRITNTLWNEVFMVMQVHDEIVCESPLEIAQEVSEVLKECMENAVTLSIPLIAEPQIAGPNGSWEDCK